MTPQSLQVIQTLAIVSLVLTLVLCWHVHRYKKQQKILLIALVMELNKQKKAQENYAKKLLEAHHQLKIAEKLKEEFMANTNHEFRSPLTAIIAFTELLLDEKTGKLNPLQVDYITEIYDSSDDLLNKVNDLRDLTRIKAGKMVLQWEKVAVDEVLMDIKKQLEPHFIKKDITLEISVANNLHYLYGDREKIKQIFSNLMVNAIKFTLPGGRVLVVVNQDLSDKKICFLIEDNGIGIDPSNHKAIFKTFYQVDGTSTRSFGGIGMGLTLVKSLVDLHGGSISLESDIGNGSRFKVMMPLYDDNGALPIRDIM